MSYKLMGEVFGITLPGMQKAVLQAMAYHANDQGKQIYPSIQRLSAETGFCERTIKRQLKVMANASLICISKPSTPTRPTEYEINLKAIRALGRGDLQSSGGVTVSPEGVTASPIRGDPQSPNQSLNSHRRGSGHPNAHPLLEKFEETLAVNFHGRNATALLTFLGQQSATPELVLKWCRWWKQNDWRGKRGELPTVNQVIETWPKAFRASKPVGFRNDD